MKRGFTLAVGSLLNEESRVPLNEETNSDLFSDVAGTLRVPLLEGVKRENKGT